LREKTIGDEKSFDRKTLEFALAELGQRAFSAGRTVEIVIHSGSALLLQPKIRLGLEEIFLTLGIDHDNDAPNSSSAP
jgi:hypothetical protein